MNVTQSNTIQVIQLISSIRSLVSFSGLLAQCKESNALVIKLLNYFLPYSACSGRFSSACQVAELLLTLKIEACN